MTTNQEQVLVLMRRKRDEGEVSDPDADRSTSEVE
jgi:hypothetical protein